MGLDVELVSDAMPRSNGLRRFGKATREAGLVDESLHVAGTEGLVGERTTDPLDDVGIASAVEKTTESSNLVLEVDSSPRDLGDVELALGRERRDAIALLRTACHRAPLEHRGNVGAVFDRLAACPRSSMVGDEHAIDEDTH